jgi:hypothetical protein
MGIRGRTRLAWLTATALGLAGARAMADTDGGAAPATPAPSVVARPAPARERPRVCYGGAPEIVGKTTPNPTNLFVAGGAAYWASDRALWRMNLRTKATEKVLDGMTEVRAFDARDAVEIDEHGELVAVDLGTKARRIVVQGNPILGIDPMTFEFLGLDADHVYYLYRKGDHRPAAKAGLYRKRRDGTGEPQQVGTEPAGLNTFILDGGFVYYAGRVGTGDLELRRRATTPDSRIERLASISGPPDKKPRARARGLVPLAVADGRAYYVAEDALFSVPVDGSAAPIRHVEVGNELVTDVVAERGCIYWATQQGLYRVVLDARGAGTRQLIADPETFSAPENFSSGLPFGRLVDTDGGWLYWVDMQGNRIMRLGRSRNVARPALARLLTKPGAAPDEAVLELEAPPGGWDADFAIHRACEQKAAAPPRCPNGPKAERWPALLPDARARMGETVRVRGPLQVKPHRFSTIAAANVGYVGLAIGGAEEVLVLDSLHCHGDNSRLCCAAPARGQEVVAEGELSLSDPSGQPYWYLKDAKVCEAPRRR